MTTQHPTLFEALCAKTEIAVDDAPKFPVEVRVEFLFNRSRAWFHPDDAREIAKLLNEAADIAEKAQAARS